MPTVVVNGEAREFPSGAAGHLIGWLRGSLGLTGTKPGCGEGECGACTVLVDGHPVLSCRVPLAEVAGSAITTIEGLGTNGHLHRIQTAMMEERASQCGYCTPAMALRAAALLDSDGDPDDDVVAAALAPNLCRCGCYPRIRRAVHGAAGAGGTDPAEHSALASVAPAMIDPMPRPIRPWDLSPVEDRDYAAVLGSGLVCVWPPSVAGLGGWATSGGAWVHVSPTGPVTAFSGKVDVGQDNATAFRALVAEELGTGLEDVRLVQGDTDLCPYDAGTFGSRSMPDSGEALRRAAAGAREVLAQIGGAGALGRDLRVIVLDEQPPLVAPADRRVVGRAGLSESRLDAVTGARKYVSDLVLPGMAFGAVLRPVVAGSTLRSAEPTAAAAMAGVVVVEEEGFVGVVADELMTARRAVAAVEADWEEPPPVRDELAAHLRAHPTSGEGWERPVEEADGDVDAALSASAVAHEATYTASYVAHVPLETRAALAFWQEGGPTVWVGTQVPFGVRAHVADALGLDESDVRIIVPPTGGGFGGKHAGDVAVEAARLARAVGRPVLVHWTRAEELRFGTVRPFAVIDVKAGLDASGALAGWDFFDINAGPAGLGLPYRSKTRRLISQPAESPLRQGSYRALGATANNFARESAIDELAHAAGFDPLEFRRANLDDDRLATVLEAAADQFGWSSRAVCGSRSATDRAGHGLAVGLEKGGRVATCAEIAIAPDGTVSVTRVVTAYDCGTVVNPDTVVNQIEGATMMALGGALVERVDVHDGRLVEASLAHYPLLRFPDVPEIEVVLVDRPDLPSAGAGETPMIAVAAAVANAVFDATGRRLRDLPLVPGLKVPEQ
ncbi:MAG: molybdopterin cofactor-binding domain-containing protein [Acidimicrobiales bacterium]